MFIIVGKIVNAVGETLGYKVSDGNCVRDFNIGAIYNEYKKGSLPIIKNFDVDTGAISLNNIDDKLLPVFYNGRCINNSIAVIKLMKIYDTDKDVVGVVVTTLNGELKTFRFSDIFKLSQKVTLYNAKIINRSLISKYGVFEVGVKYNLKDFEIKGDCLVKYKGADSHVDIPSCVTSIGECAFEECNGLTSITIPNSVKSIGEGAFKYCKGLTSITIPDSVTSIGSGAFFSCSGLVSVMIHDSVKSIETETFMDCTGLTSITIPDSVTSIGYGAFEDCTGLTSITIPDSVTSIGDYAFSRCEGLTSITIPDSVTSIGYVAFGGCVKLRSVNIPESVTSIGEHFYLRSNIFVGCIGLKNITVDKNNKKFYAKDGILYDKDKMEFMSCPQGKTGTVNIPDGVKSIGSGAFKECTGLANCDSRKICIF